MKTPFSYFCFLPFVSLFMGCTIGGTPLTFNRFLIGSGVPLGSEMGEGPELGLRRFTQLGRYNDRLLIRTEPHGFEYADTCRWSEDPKDLLYQAITARFRSSGAFSVVADAADILSPSGAVLSAEVLRFDYVQFEKKVECAVHFELKSGRAGRFAWTGTLVSEIPCASLAEVPGAMEKALDSISKQALERVIEKM